MAIRSGVYTCSMPSNKERSHYRIKKVSLLYTLTVLRYNTVWRCFWI